MSCRRPRSIRLLLRKSLGRCHAFACIDNGVEISQFQRVHRRILVLATSPLDRTCTTLTPFRVWRHAKCEIEVRIGREWIQGRGEYIGLRKHDPCVARRASTAIIRRLQDAYAAIRGLTRAPVQQDRAWWLARLRSAIQRHAIDPHTRGNAEKKWVSGGPATLATNHDPLVDDVSTSKSPCQDGATAAGDESSWHVIVSDIL